MKIVINAIGADGEPFDFYKSWSMNLTPLNRVKLFLFGGRVEFIAIKEEEGDNQ